MEDSIEETMVTSFFIYDLIYGDLDKANRMKTSSGKVWSDGVPQLCAMTIMVITLGTVPDLGQQPGYGIKMDYLALLKEFIKTSAANSMHRSLSDRNG